MIVLNKTYSIDNNINKTIVLISDIHYQDKRDIKRLTKVFNKIKKINPDYTCIPGDLIDTANIKDSNLLIDFLKQLSTICKVIISIGNHEFYISRKEKKYGFNTELFKQIKSIKNIYVLDNENVVIDNINFIGLTLPKDYYFKYGEKDSNFKKYLNNVKINKKYYNVLLCHSPLEIINQNTNADLILCGHTHGGILPNIFRLVIKHGGLISPSKELFPKYTYGKIRRNNTDIITTRGISVLPKKLGILTNLYSSEVVIIKIK